MRNRGDELPGPVKWVVLEPEAVPDRWKGRARYVALIPLVGSEGDQVLAGEPAAPDISAQDEGLARLIARGLSTSEIARRLSVSERSIERRTASLRKQFGLQSKEELSLFLARQGF